MKRREFIQNASALASSIIIAPSILNAQNANSKIIGVLGVIQPKEMGITLMHEHVIADFIGAAKTGTHRYDVDTVCAKALPYLLELKKTGCKTFVDCTPAYLGRDVRILKRLATASGLNIITNTGYYGAAKENFLPPQAYSETAEQLAARWIDEFKNGIESTGIIPGFIKTSVDEGPLRPVYQKLLKASALTHLQTGLTISAHTGNGEAALQEIEVLKQSGVHASAFRWVHAQNEPDLSLHLKAARMGAWLEYDGINPTEDGNTTRHVALVKHAKENGLLGQTLISQDAGWYWVGEPEGGTFRGFTALFDTFIPALKKERFTDKEINQLMVVNPINSLEIKVRRL